MNEKAAEPVEVKYDDLLGGIECSSLKTYPGSKAYIHRKTGKIYYNFDEMEQDPDLPEDWKESDEYIQIPGKITLDLGNRLAFDFASKVLPQHYDQIRSLFRGSGAYRRFKDFLENQDALEKWFEFESDATESALREWAEKNGFWVTASERPKSR